MRDENRQKIEIIRSVHNGLGENVKGSNVLPSW